MSTLSGCLTDFRGVLGWLVGWFEKGDGGWLEKGDGGWRMEGGGWRVEGGDERREGVLLGLGGMRAGGEWGFPVIDMGDLISRD